MAGMAGMRSGGARKIEKGRQKGVDELDPYVKVTLGPFGKKKETKALKDGGRDPDFLAVHGNELRFEVPSHMPVATGEPALKFECYDSDIGRDDFLGQCELPLWAIIDPDRYTKKVRQELEDHKTQQVDLLLGQAEEQRDAFNAAAQGRRMLHRGKISGARRMSAPDIFDEPTPETAKPLSVLGQVAEEMAAGLPPTMDFGDWVGGADGKGGPAPAAAAEAQGSTATGGAAAADAAGKEDEDLAGEQAAAGKEDEATAGEQAALVPTQTAGEQTALVPTPPALAAPEAPRTLVGPTSVKVRPNDYTAADLESMRHRRLQQLAQKYGLRGEKRPNGELRATGAELRAFLRGLIAPPSGTDGSVTSFIGMGGGANGLGLSNNESVLARLAEAEGAKPWLNQKGQSDLPQLAMGRPGTPDHACAPGTVKRMALCVPSGEPHKGWIEFTVAYEAAVEATGASSKLRFDGMQRELGANGLPLPGSGGVPEDGEEEYAKVEGGTVVVTILRCRTLTAVDAAQMDDGISTDMTLVYAAAAALVLYIALGILFYRFTEEHCGEDEATGLEVCEPWTAVDALYFTTMTFTTIGYGDMGPTTDAGKLFTACFALTGVTLIGAALGIVAGYIMDVLDAKMTKAMDEPEEGESAGSAKKNFELERQKAKKKALVKNVVYMVAVIVVGMALFLWQEGAEERSDMSFGDAFYGAVITASSVGYGDYSFSTQTGRFISIFYMMISVLTTSNFVAGISGYIIDAKQQQLIQRSLNRKLRISDILEMDEDSDGEVDKLEFLTKMLVRLRKCEQDDIDEILQRFDDLDIDGSGALDMKDILLGGNQAV